MSQGAGVRGFAAARGGALFRTAWLLTGDWQLAEDLVQETLARLYVRWRKVARMDNPAAYARTGDGQRAPLAPPAAAQPGDARRATCRSRSALRSRLTTPACG